ncbi:MAG: hypothetical protein MJA82_15645 [Clostridia bacterium]|nr:hypothetical protein [Clostridia bacterium]
MSKKTEGVAVNAVEDIIYKSKIVEPDIRRNDKTPCWDGDLLVYKKPSEGNYDHRKKYLNNKIPVQIKGKTVKKLSSDTAYHYFDRDDLSIYRENGGIILFLVQIDQEENRKVFYIPLLPYDLKTLLKDSKKEKGEIRVDFNHIDPSMINEFEEICENFILNRELQYSTKKVELPLEEAKCLILKGVLRHSRLEDYILSNPLYLYGTRNKHDDIPLIVDKIDIDEIEKKLIKTISIYGKKYFDTYKVKRTREYMELIFSNNLIFKFKEDKLNIKYISHDNFDENLKLVEFIKFFMDNRGFSISEDPIKLINKAPDPDKHEEINNWYKTLCNIATLLDVFNIDYSEFNMNNISQNDLKNLNILIDSIVFGHDVSYIKNISGMFRVDIANISLLVMVHKNSNGKVIIENFNNLKKEFFRFTSKDIDGKANVESSYEFSPFIILSLEDILLFTNIKPHLIKEGIQSSEYSEKVCDSVVNLLLNIIKAYDETQDIDYLDSSLGICTWLKENNPSNPVHLINEYQIYSRQRELTQEEVARLKNMIENQKNHTEYISLLCCINILLNKFSEFKECFNQLSEDQRKEFVNYPIYTLYSNKECKPLSFQST